MTPLAARPGYGALTVYRQEAGPVEFDLSDNTNLFGSAPSALASVAAWAGRSPARYPSLAGGALRAAIAGWQGVADDEVVGGCGSNDILDAVMRAFGEPGFRLAYPSPTFVMTPHFAAANSLVPVAVETLPDGSPDIDALLATGAEIIYVASPNNPSGRAAPERALTALLDQAPGLVILDEAYVEYAGGSRAAEAPGRGNVLVTRTFSKAWGLAGLRLGYGIGARELVLEVEKARGPYKVNAVAEQAAAAAVREDRAWLDTIVAATVSARRRTVDAVTALGFRVMDSDANFIAVTVPDARSAAATLAARGVGVRAFIGAPVLGDLLRVTVGPDEMMAAFLAGLAEVRA